MAVATSYDLPQYLGDLFQKGEKPNAFLNLVGGVGTYRTVDVAKFPMGVDFSLASAAQPNILEGATPTPSQTSTNQASNIIQIFQYAVSLTYSALAQQGKISGIAAIPGRNGPVVQPGTLEWQINVKVLQAARDLNLSTLRGTYQEPSDNTTSRKMRGVRTAVTTNLFANGGTPRAITTTIIDTALQTAMENGMFSRGEVLKVLGDATQIGKVIALYESSTQQPISREEAGVTIRRVHTKWATLDLVWEPDMASGEIFITRPEKCQLVAMPVPKNGVLFVEPLAKVGSAETAQLYGELSVDYTNEIFHAVIDDLS